ATYAPAAAQPENKEEPGEIRVWDVADSKSARTLRAPKELLLGLALSRDGGRMFAVAHDNGSKLWDVAGGRELAVAQKGGVITGAAFSPTEDLLALAGEGGVSLWDRANRTVRHLKVDPVSFVVAFSRDGKLLAADAGREGVKLWEIATGRVVACFPAAALSV